MKSATQLRNAIHQLRLGDIYYDVETVRTKIGFQSTWACLKCHASRRLQAELADDVEQQAFASVEGHHLFFHSDHGSSAPSLNLIRPISEINTENKAFTREEVAIQARAEGLPSAEIANVSKEE